VPEAAETVLPRQGSSDQCSLQWMAPALTPGLGPTKARRLDERFGGAQAIFDATLTELEAAGIPAVAAQSLGTGRSMELANDEIARTSMAGIRVIVLEDAAYPAPLKQIYDPPLVLYVRGGGKCTVSARNRRRGHAPSHHVRHRHGGAFSL